MPRLLHHISARYLPPLATCIFGSIQHWHALNEVQNDCFKCPRWRNLPSGALFMPIGRYLRSK